MRDIIAYRQRFDALKTEMKDDILKLMAERKTPCEMSIIYEGLREKWMGEVPVYFAAFAAVELRDEGLLWMIPVPEDDPQAEYLLFGTPQMEKPEDPIAYLGLLMVGSDEHGYMLIQNLEGAV
jgi:hypothetical protein